MTVTLEVTVSFEVKLMPLARKVTVQWLPGNYYHIYNRGARRGKLFDQKFVDTYFETPEDYSTFVLDYLMSRDLPEEIRIYLENLEK